MYRLKKPDIHASEISGLINKELVGENIVVNIPSSFEEIISNSFICFLVQNKYDKNKIISM